MFPYFRRLRPIPSPAKVAAAGGVLIYDTFTGANGTALTAHAPDINTPGGAWVQINGTWTIQSNRASVAGDGNVRIAAGVSNYSLSVIAVAVSATSAAGLTGRVQDSSNLWAIQIVNSTNVFRIAEVNGGVTTVRATTSVTISDGVSYTMAGTFNGATITATLDGANSLSYGSATFLQTDPDVGLRAGNDTCTFDDFTVTAI